MSTQLETVKQEVVKNKSLLARAAVVVVAVGVLALSSGIIWSAASAGLGLLALGAVGIVGLGVIQALPWLGQKWENKLLALRKAEASRNPIEQLQNYFRQKSEQLAAFKQATAAIGGQIGSLEDMVAERKRKKPDADCSKQERTITLMRKAHNALVGKYNEGEKALKELKEAIEDQTFAWNFAQAGDAASKALNATSGEALVQEMLADEAFASVRNNFNRVFADLEMEAAKINSGDRLQIEGTSETFDTSKIQIPNFAAVPISRS